MSEEQADYNGNEPKCMSFFMSCIPPKTTSQQKGIMMTGGKPMHFKKKAVRDTETTLAALLAEHRPEQPYGGPVSLSVHWIYPWRTSEPKKNRIGGIKFCDTRPDCSNIIKTLEDVMTKLGFWNDDSQIASLHVQKYWGDKPGIGISIGELRQDEICINLENKY
jgi:Holliday junction resolvase RusA-like endonuclease